MASPTPHHLLLPEKTRAVHTIESSPIDGKKDIELNPERRHLLSRSHPSEIRQRYVQPHKRLLVLLVTLLLACVLVTIGALKFNCDDHAGFKSLEPISGLFKRVSGVKAPLGWKGKNTIPSNEKRNPNSPFDFDEVDSQNEKRGDFKFRQPKGWKPPTPNAYEKRGEAPAKGAFSPKFRNPMGWHPHAPIPVNTGAKEKRVAAKTNWKTPKGWTGGKIGSLNEKRDSAAPAWKKPKGWTGGKIGSLNERDTAVPAWKKPKGWNGKKIGSLEKKSRRARRLRGYRRRGGRRGRRPRKSATPTATEIPEATATSIDEVEATPTPTSTSTSSPDNSSSSSDTSIMIPLYSYPGDSATDWTTIFSTISASPTTKFTIIINPSNGPGTTPLDTNFQTGIRTLNSFPNTLVLGYVHQLYGERDQSDVQADLDTYASFSSQENGAVKIDGIFFDESPDKAEYLSFVQSVNTYARQQGFTTLVHNSGTIPDAGYFADSIGTDITVVLEDSQEDYEASAGQYDNLEGQFPGATRGKTAFIIYEATSDAQELHEAVARMKGQVGHLFLSDLVQEQAYTSVSGEHLGVFVEGVEKALAEEED